MRCRLALDQGYGNQRFPPSPVPSIHSRARGLEVIISHISYKKSSKKGGSSDHPVQPSHYTRPLARARSCPAVATLQGTSVRDNSTGRGEIPSRNFPVSQSRAFEKARSKKTKSQPKLFWLTRAPVSREVAREEASQGRIWVSKSGRFVSKS